MTGTTTCARPYRIPPGLRVRGEKHGEHYFFVSEKHFQALIAQEAFLEYALVFGDYKGTTHAAVEHQLEAGYHVLLDIDWQGARQVRGVLPESHSIFILPPSLEALKQRLAGRGQDSPEVIAERMGHARSEISHWDEFDHVIINDDFEVALAELQSIIRDGQPANPVGEEKLQSLLEELLQDG